MTSQRPPARPVTEFPKPSLQSRGAAGEQLTVDWYIAQGYQILDRNWRTRKGELDIVCQQNNVIVFCEVKTRASTMFGAPIESITPAKAQRIRMLALAWMGDHGEPFRELRFDVASVMPNDAGELAVEMFEGVF